MLSPTSAYKTKNSSYIAHLFLKKVAKAGVEKLMETLCTSDFVIITISTMKTDKNWLLSAHMHIKP